MAKRSAREEKKSRRASPATGFSRPRDKKTGRFRPLTKQEKLARKRPIEFGPPKKRPSRPTRSIAAKFAQFGGGGAVRSEKRIRELEEGLKVMKEKGVEWVRGNGAPAVQPSMLRHVPGAADMVRDLNRVAEFTGTKFLRAVEDFAAHRKVDVKVAYQLLKQGYDGPFSPGFRRVAQFIAQKYSVPLREVYTLWFSP